MSWQLCCLGGLVFCCRGAPVDAHCSAGGPIPLWVLFVGGERLVFRRFVVVVLRFGRLGPISWMPAMQFLWFFSGVRLLLLWLICGVGSRVCWEFVIGWLVMRFLLARILNLLLGGELLSGILLGQWRRLTLTWSLTLMYKPLLRRFWDYSRDWVWAKGCCDQQLEDTMLADPLMHPNRWLRAHMVPPSSFLRCDPAATPDGSGILSPVRTESCWLLWLCGRGWGGVACFGC